MTTGQEISDDTGRAKVSVWLHGHDQVVKWPLTSVSRGFEQAEEQRMTRQLDHNHGTDIEVGDRVTGRCVTMGSQYTGRVAEILHPAPFQSGIRFRLVDTGKHYAGGRPIEPIVEAVSLINKAGDGSRG